MKITICWSMAFAQEMIIAQALLQAKWHEVIVPENTDKYANNTMDVENKWEKIEIDAIRAYYNKIWDSDAILVLNYDKKWISNYIWGNSLIEIAFAHVLDKKIFLLNPVPNLSYTDEIEAMKPIVLNGDLGLIG